MSVAARRNAGPTASNEYHSTMSAEQISKSDPLADVVQLCKSGRRDAQQELYEACHQDVYGLMVRMVGRQDAADVTQQVFMQVFRKIDQFQGQSKFKTWLYRLAVNESLQHLRKNKRKQQVLAHDPVDERPSLARQREAKDVLEAALERLEPLLRSIFLLKESQGLSYREIAEATDIPEGTVGSRLNRARRQLREHLIELGWEQ
jgi:RNA polymerase sigma-70 factor (ECF subfamily)